MCIVKIISPLIYSLYALVISCIPLCFRCFKGTDNPEAFKLSLINEGISFVHNLFKNKKCNLIFLADRWFNFREIMQHIQDLGDTYCIRTKSNVSIEIDNYKDSDIINSISDIEPLFTLVYIATLWLIILGSDYSKNSCNFKNCFKFKCSKRNGKNKKRTFSLFNTGLFLFNIAFESTKYFVLKCNFMLYDL